MGKKLFKFISSMRFAIILLVLLAAVCALGSFVTQGQSYAWYAARYSDRTAAWIVAAHLDDVYHSWWFIGISLFLCCNLLLCNLIRLPQLVRRTRGFARADAPEGESATAEAEDVREPERLFAHLHMPKPSQSRTAEGEQLLFSHAHRAGLWGAWVCHLGILLLILGFGLGQMTHEEYVLYGVPGQTRQIGETSLFLTIDDFRVDLREDDTVSQYTADITVRDLSADHVPEERATIRVNSPATLFGLRFYQNSTGWAATVRIQKGGELLQEEILCAGEYVSVADMPELAVYLNAFYPDYVMEPGVGPRTASGRLENPAYLYTVYYRDQVEGMNVLQEGETITIDDYTVTFSDPQSYTVIQCRRDRFSLLALLGGLVTLAGLFLAFYLQPKRMWAVRQADGSWTVRAQCRKGGAIFREQFEGALGDDPGRCAEKQP